MSFLLEWLIVDLKRYFCLRLRVEIIRDKVHIQNGKSTPYTPNSVLKSKTYLIAPMSRARVEKKACFTPVLPFHFASELTLP